jgi:hypothetical protein
MPIQAVSVTGEVGWLCILLAGSFFILHAANKTSGDTMGNAARSSPLLFGHFPNCHNDS